MSSEYMQPGVKNCKKICYLLYKIAMRSYVSFSNATGVNYKGSFIFIGKRLMGFLYVYLILSCSYELYKGVPNRCNNGRHWPFGYVRHAGMLSWPAIFTELHFFAFIQFLVSNLQFQFWLLTVVTMLVAYWRSFACAVLKCRTIRTNTVGWIALSLPFLQETVSFHLFNMKSRQGSIEVFTTYMIYY